MQQDLTQGSIRAGLIRFSLPLIAGNLLQQLYNVADTLIVGRFLGHGIRPATSQNIYLRQMTP